MMAPNPNDHKVLISLNAIDPFTSAASTQPVAFGVRNIYFFITISSNHQLIFVGFFFVAWEDLIAPYPGGRSRSSSPTPVVPRNSQTQQPTNSQPLRDTEMSSSHSMQYPVPVSPSKRGRGDSSPDAKSPTMPASKRVASGNMSSTSTASMASPSTRKTLTPAEMRKRHEAILTAQQLIPSQEIDVIPSQESTVSGDAEDTLVRLDTEIQNMRNLLHSLQSSQQRDESPIEVEEMTAMSRGTQANLFEDENEAKFWAGTSFNTESSIESHNPGSSRPPRLPAVIPENTSIEWDPTPRRPSTPQANTTHARDGNGGASTKMLPTPPNSSQAEHVRAYSMAESHYRNTNEDDDDELPKTPTRSKGKERELPTTPTSSQWQRTRAEPVSLIGSIHSFIPPLLRVLPPGRPENRCLFC